MYDEVDYSNQGTMKFASFFVYIVMMFILLSFALSIPPETSINDDLMLLFIFMAESFAGILVGSILGFLTKSSIRISTDGMVFEEKITNLDDFGSVYYKGEDAVDELAGHPPSGCTWILIIVTVPIIMFFAVLDMAPFLAGIILAVSSAFLYPVGYYLIKRAAPIRTNMVKNPIYRNLTEYLTIEGVLKTLKKCQYVDHLIVKFRQAQNELVNLIDDVRVFIVTKTDPVLEIEVTLENMHNIGLELTLVLNERLTASQKEETIKVGGTNTLLTVKDTGMNTLISISYMMNRIRERFALGNATKNCNLLEALLHELKQHISELTILDSDPLYG